MIKLIDGNQYYYAIWLTNRTFPCLIACPEIPEILFKGLFVNSPFDFVTKIQYSKVTVKLFVNSIFAHGWICCGILWATLQRGEAGV